MSAISIGNTTLDDVGGEPEEIAELKSMVDDVELKCYNGRRADLVADLAQVVVQQACTCKDQPHCKELVEVVQSWMTAKLAELKAAEEVVQSLFDALDDFGCEEDPTDPDAWGEAGLNSSKSEHDLMLENHYKDPTADIEDQPTH